MHFPIVNVKIDTPLALIACVLPPARFQECQKIIMDVQVCLASQRDGLVTLPGKTNPVATSRPLCADFVCEPEFYLY